MRISRRSAIHFAAAFSAGGVLGIVVANADSKSAANESNFRAAIAAYLADAGDNCIPAGNETPGKWPIEVAASIDRQVNSHRALVAAGLLRRTELETGGGTTKAAAKHKVVQYDLTEQAKPFVRHKASMGLLTSGDSLCWSRKAVDKIVNWSDAPANQWPGAPKRIVVVYTYKLVDVAPWAANPALGLQAGGSDLARAGEGKEQRLVLRLTNNGWEVAAP